MTGKARARIGVVLGSGGIKTLAAVELFRFLQREKIEIDLLVGCSGGAILSCLYGCGYTPDEIVRDIRTFWNRSLFGKRDWRTLLGLIGLPFCRFRMGRAILDPAPIRKALTDFFGDRRIEDLKPRTIIQTTDAETGEGVPLNSGPIAQALYASGAQLPFLPPERINGQWLVDGAYSSALPIMEAVKHNVDVIIAMTPEVQVSEPHGFIDFYLHFLSRCFRVSERSQTSLAVHLHHHEIVIVDVRFGEVINMWNVEKIPNVLEAGRQAVERQAGEILAAIDSFKGR